MIFLFTGFGAADFTHRPAAGSSQAAARLDIAVGTAVQPGTA